MTTPRPRPLLDRLRTRGPDGEQGFAMVFAILLILVVAGLSLALAGTLYSQVAPTQFQRKAVQTVNAAQAGIQVSLQQLRATVRPNGEGAFEDLPCTDGSSGAVFTDSGVEVPVRGTTLRGTVAAQPADLRYRVSIAYFVANPSGQPASWLQANALTCPGGVLNTVPTHALLQGYGEGAALPGRTERSGNRTQRATYTFRTTTANVSGGRLVHLPTNLCMSAANPVIGQPVRLQTCLAIGTPSQTWLYRKDLTLLYGGDANLDLCIEMPTSGAAPTLQDCTGSGTGQTYPYVSDQHRRQQWGYNDNGHFSLARTDGTVTSGEGPTCLLLPGSPGPGSALTTGSCFTMTAANQSYWNPDPEVGAGKAGGNTSGMPGEETYQYVNYAEFGRCLDITSARTDPAFHNFLINYPCKQAPDSSTLLWNQVWRYTPLGTTGFGTMSVNAPTTLRRSDNTVSYPAGRYCLFAPASSTTPFVEPCQTVPPDAQLWAATGAVPGDPASSYRLVSRSRNLCLATSGLRDTSFGSSRIRIEACSGDLRQKWNAPPADLSTSLGNISETVGAR